MPTNRSAQLLTTGLSPDSVDKQRLLAQLHQACAQRRQLWAQWDRAEKRGNKNSTNVIKEALYYQTIDSLPQQCDSIARSESLRVAKKALISGVLIAAMNLAACTNNPLPVDQPIPLIATRYQSPNGGQNYHYVPQPHCVLPGDVNETNLTI